MESSNKKRKNVLIIATTVFHIISAVQIKRKLCSGYSVDLIIGDETPNMEKITDNIKNTKLFKNVYFVKMNDYNKNKGKYELYSPLQYVLKKYIDVFNIFHPHVKYDLFLFPFFHHFHMNLYSFIKRFINPKVKAYLYEEGTGIYSTMGAIYQSKLKEYQEVSEYKHFRYGRLLHEFRGIITFNPSLFQWGQDIPKKKLPCFNLNDKEMLVLLNKIFNYNGELQPLYEKKVIFFEEAKMEDGMKINDLGVVNNIANMIGQDQILIKLHPRTTENRFEKFGFCTCKNTIIPWEVIFMNHGTQDCVLISTASSSIVYPVLIFNKKIIGIFLFDMVHVPLPAELKSHEQFIKNVLAKKYPECFYIPQSNQELEEILCKKGNK